MEGPLLVLRVLLALVCVVGIIWYAGRRLGGQAQARRASHEPSVRLVGRQTIGRHNGVAVLAVGTRRILVGYGDTQVTMLTELDPVEEEAPAAQATLVPAPHPSPEDAVDGLPVSVPDDARALVTVPVGAVVAPSPLQGSLLAPSTWRQAWHVMQERTVRR
ncbi:flagellar biosynthetic protein FliO [Cellulomonas soli]|uniref:Flagellar protein n=1 Tax=Cellulomonas soli TaxID=931535 RepID=A0A512PEP8_9CELL|nr:flagellar biosynthetic protein FliO [Cellulomonas soli]NYI59551.1 flagellar protein FliO/FliZ [Cellulomonas soli]GEP69658.1 hypothetical protein CSO01_23730 [Cellulomonas soli]